MLRRPGIYATLLLVISLCSIAILAAYTMASHFTLRARLNEEIQHTARTALQRALTVLPPALWEYNDIYIRDYISSNFLVDEIAYVRIVSEGEVYERAARTYQDLSYEDFRDPTRFYHASTVITYDKRAIGTFELAISYATMDKTLSRNMTTSFMLSACIVTVLGLAILILVRLRIIRPLKAMERVTDRVSAGDLTARTGMRGGDEIGRLGLALDHMIKSLRHITASRDELDAEMKRRVEAEREIAQKNELIQLYLDVAEVSLLALKPDGDITMLNRRGRELLGCVEEDVIGLNWFENFVPEELREERARVFKLVATGQQAPPHHAEVSILTRTGDVRLVVWHHEPIRDKDGTIVGVLSSGQDITEARAAENALRQSEERYRLLVESMNEGVISIDAHGTITYTNQRFCTLLDYAGREIVGRSLESFVIEKDLPKFRELMRGLHCKDATPMELALRRQDGQRTFTFCSPAPDCDEHGEFRGATIAVADITQLKNLESQLIQAQMLESIGSLAAGIAHEINTPCQYVSNNVQFITEAYRGYSSVVDRYEAFRRTALEGGDVRQASGELDRFIENTEMEMLREELPQALEETREGLARITTIVQSVKQFAHPGKDEIIPADLNEAVKNSVTVSTNEWKVYANVTMYLDETLPEVPCVISQISQVLLNLIVNASFAISEKVQAGTYAMGSIVIRTGVENGMAVVTVEDNGTGIPERARDHIFKPFFTTKAPGQGTGQGLSISHTTIVEKHKGSFTFETEEDVGTTFRIALPLQTEAA